MNTYTSKMWMVFLFILLSFQASYTLALSSVNAPSLKITEDTQSFFRAEVGIPYILGDNNTKLLARNLAMKENNIKMSKLAGASIRISENKENDQLTQQQIAQLTSTIMIANIVNERFYVAGQNMGVFLTVKVDIDKKAY
ncbi:hypothetical protein ACLKMH_23460 [Psychromonas sp. KJ10-10]|uniref:hypothetical protein n=1 Tax=Psychromonas sp. KJ10-10 TaxID=3391823 RepID=UPI0039B44673